MPFETVHKKDGNKVRLVETNKTLVNCISNKMTDIVHGAKTGLKDNLDVLDEKAYSADQVAELPLVEDVVSEWQISEAVDMGSELNKTLVYGMHVPTDTYPLIVLLKNKDVNCVVTPVKKCYSVGTDMIRRADGNLCERVKLPQDCDFRYGFKVKTVSNGLLVDNLVRSVIVTTGTVPWCDAAEFTRERPLISIALAYTSLELVVEFDKDVLVKNKNLVIEVSWMSGMIECGLRKETGQTAMRYDDKVHFRRGLVEGLNDRPCVLTAKRLVHLPKTSFSFVLDKGHKLISNMRLSVVDSSFNVSGVIDMVVMTSNDTEKIVVKNNSKENSQVVQLLTKEQLLSQHHTDCARVTVSGVYHPIFSDDEAGNLNMHDAINKKKYLMIEYDNDSTKRVDCKEYSMLGDVHVVDGEIRLVKVMELELDNDVKRLEDVLMDVLVDV